MLAEGGRHDDPSAADHCEAALWITMVHAGLIDRQIVADEYNTARECLRSTCKGTSGFFNIVHHHKIAPEDEFVMRPGYAGFQPIEEGELLAHDVRGEVRAPTGGRILMPLYKPPCDDGFLIVREMDAPGA
jgi:hypothetical protein